MSDFLYLHQKDALEKMKNGCILNGGVGSGKSRTSLAYYYTRNGGKFHNGKISRMKNPKNLFIITTAKKRDDKEWEEELIPFRMSPDQDLSLYKNTVVIDSWNNIGKYRDVKDAFFIFDEDRVTGKGKWAITFIKIAKHNEWIILSATPGDTWEDYAAVFIANGFYRGFTDFRSQHIVYSRYVSYPLVERYLNTGRLMRLRRSILIDMDFERSTVRHDHYIDMPYDKSSYRLVNKDRWNIFEDKPIENASELCYTLRKIVNSDPYRAEKVKELSKTNHRLIIFYNFDYELDILKSIDFGKDYQVAEWNGHAHQPVPDGKKWVYLVQYTAGAEGWNCIKTDTIIFYSLNYSYKVVEQARGRIDRMNTMYIDLHYYYFKSGSQIDLAIYSANKRKKQFNEGKFVYSNNGRA